VNRFLHIADIHLGKHQHQSDARYGDYFAALTSVVDYALREKVNALLIAGDLFDEQEPSAETIRRAAAVLRPLREGGISVFAVEGNHDRRKRTEPSCALDILAGEGYMQLLRPVIADGKLTLPLYSPEEGGGMVEVAEGVVIAGLGFLGHNAEDYHRQAAELLPENAFAILLSHVMVSPDERTLEYGCIAYQDLAPLRERIGYLALGHRHTRVGMTGEMDGWVFNPGSLEFVNSLDYRLPPELRGFFDVTISESAGASSTGEESSAGEAGDAGESRDAAGDATAVRSYEHQGKQVCVRHVMTDKRPAHTLRPDISDCDKPDAVIDAVRSVAETEMSGELRARHPIVIVRLQGTLALSRSRLPRAAISRMLIEDYGALLVEVMDRDVLGTAEVGALLLDNEDLEQVADRARAVATDLLKAAGIAVGREHELSALLIDLKTQLHGSAKSPSKEVLQGLRQQLLLYVEFDEEGGEA
jgi:predicted phosphodiesterase